MGRHGIRYRSARCCFRRSNLPIDARIVYIKRVVGLPGHIIQVVGGLLTINGNVVERQRIDDYKIEHWSGGPRKVAQYVERPPDGASHRIIEIKGDAGYFNDTTSYKVSPGPIFVMDDNSFNSRDLKRVGYVPVENLLGRQEIIYFSIAERASRCDGSLFLRWDRMFKTAD